MISIGNKEPAAIKKIPFSVIEAYKNIRTNILFLLSQSSCKTITISSSIEEEGKSTTAVNIAIVFSQLGSRVLLIDGDMRRPSIHKKMHLPNNDGLSSVLVNFCQFEDAIQHINPSLDVLTAGPTPPNPSEMLGSVAFSQFIDRMHTQYDYVIFDTPPLNIVSDALVISPQTDGLILVARDRVVTHSQIKYALNKIEFAQVRLLGTVINGVDARSSSRMYYENKSRKRKRKKKRAAILK